MNVTPSKLQFERKSKYLLTFLLYQISQKSQPLIKQKIRKENIYEQNRIYHSFNGTSGDSETAGNHVRLSG